MSKSPVILVVDDNEDIRDLLQIILEREGYVVQRAKNAKNALIKARLYKPSLILLDIMMPDKDGIMLCRDLREVLSKKTRIVFLTARDEEYSEVAGFEAGADDFIIKPIKAQALVRRIGALLRREDQKENEPLLEVGGFCMDANRYTVCVKDKVLSLRKREFEVLYFLASHPDQFFSRDTLLSRVWGDDSYITPRTVDVHIRRIREQIGGEHIITLKGVGYAFTV